MEEYRAYVIGPDGHIINRVDIRCSDEKEACSATIWMGTQRQSGWPFRRSRREDDCRDTAITQAIFW